MQRKLEMYSEVERAMIVAQGKMLTLLTVSLQAKGFDAADFAEKVALFSAVVAEEQPLEGEILSIWAGTLVQATRVIAPAR